MWQKLQYTYHTHIHRHKVANFTLSHQWFFCSELSPLRGRKAMCVHICTRTPWVLMGTAALQCFDYVEWLLRINLHYKTLLTKQPKHTHIHTHTQRHRYTESNYYSALARQYYCLNVKQEIKLLGHILVSKESPHHSHCHSTQATMWSLSHVLTVTQP